LNIYDYTRYTLFFIIVMLHIFIITNEGGRLHYAIKQYREGDPPAKTNPTEA
jgi:hypothetical protein